MDKRFEFREVRPEEAAEVARIEEICFPPNEACSEAQMRARTLAAPETFLVAVDRETGVIAGFLNGLATDETAFRDAFFEDAKLHQPNGKHVMLLGLDVRPEYRGRGLARELVQRYAQREQARGRESLILTCLAEKVAMYERMGFRDLGMANSAWGGEAWHEMSRALQGERRQARLLEAMIAYDGGDARRIQHFLKVWSFAKLIGELEGLDAGTQKLLETAAIVHDIGIKVCEEKYGSCTGKQQELEGPPLAEELLRSVGYDEATVQRAAFLVGHHHTYTGVEGLDWQILLEADFLVNSYEDAMSAKSIEAFARRVFRTPSGIRLLRLQSGLELEACRENAEAEKC